MVEHRKNIPPRKTYVPSSWLIVLTALVCVGGAGWLGWLIVGDDSSDSTATSGATRTTPSTTATPKPSATTSEPAPTESAPTPTPTPSDTPSADVARDVEVSVLNNSGIQGAARAYSTKVTEAGWPLGGIGNWRGVIGANTVYYPAAFEAQGRLLAKDLGIARVLPSLANMRTDRLTIILSGPQS